jgi:putative permease
MHILREWYHRYFSDPQVIILGVVLIGGAAIILMLGNILAPVLAGVVIAYLLEGLVGFLERRRIPRLAAVLLVFITFVAFILFLLLALMPKLSLQVGQAVAEMPSMLSRGQQQLMRLPEKYPELISQDQIVALVKFIQTEVGRWGQKLLSVSVASVRGLVAFLVYLVLLPLLVFFFLKDKVLILDWVNGLLPENRTLTNEVLRDVDRQIGRYIRGKFWEILIIWSASYFVFFLLGLRFAVLISMLVGLSVLVPYIGVTVVTLPVALVAYYQWGLSSEFVSVLIAYTVIQLLDGNLLVPLLLSEVVNLHPIAIIVAVLVFGGLWGFWGVFFAIPLATLVQAVLRSWPRKSRGSRAGDAKQGPEKAITETSDPDAERN